MRYRVIGTDGLEHELASLPDWDALIRAGLLQHDSLYWDEEAARWRPVTRLETYRKAKQLIGDSEGPANSTPAEIDSDTAAATLPEAWPEPDFQAPPRPRQKWRIENLLAVAIGGIVCAALIVALWIGNASRMPAVLSQIPPRAYLALFLIAALFVAEEFLWLLLRMLQFRRSSFFSRLSVQAVAALITGAAIYVASVAAPDLSRWAAWGERYGLHLEPNFPRRLVNVVLYADPATALNVIFVQNVAVVAIIYALAFFLASGPFLPRLGFLKRSVASIAIAAMLFGTVHMALVPLLSPPPGRAPPRLSQAPADQPRDQAVALAAFSSATRTPPSGFASPDCALQQSHRVRGSA